MEYQGIVLYRNKGLYSLYTKEFDTLICKVKGNLFQSSRYDNQIAVGDKVYFTKEPQNDVGLIHKIEVRNSFLSRSRVEKDAVQILAANVDSLIIVSSCKRPPLRHNLILRMLIAAFSGNIKPILVISKTDLMEPSELTQLSYEYEKCGIEVIFHSIYSKDSHEQLHAILKKGVHVISGHSGVGKTSLLNQLFPKLNLKVGALNKKSFKGSHTTTYAQMFQVSKTGFVIDTPGIREYGLWEVNQKNLADFFPGMETFIGQCFHRNCLHNSEPKCAVKKAVIDKSYSSFLYKGYLGLLKSLSPRS